MNELTIEQITAELASVLVGQRFGKIFALGKLVLAIDFRLPTSTFLLVAVEPTAPRVYLINRRLRDLEKQSVHQPSFIHFARKRVAGAVVEAVEKIPGERALKISLRGVSELGVEERHALVVQLTGRSSNLFLLDANGFVIDKLRETFGEGQDVATRYAPPGRAAGYVKRVDEPFPLGAHATLSEALDEFYLEKESAGRFASRAKAAQNKIRQEISKRRKLLAKLNADLANHGDADDWKRRGDLILANLADAVSVDGKLLVVDYFDENVPTIELDIDENESLTQNAERFFKRYTKARNAQSEIARRVGELESELSLLAEREIEIEDAIVAQDEEFLTAFVGDQIKAKAAREHKSDTFAGARSFKSAEGYEILVGKASKDNDHLTFRIAKSLDLWLHAADYPGSHVVIRNPSRGEIPQKTLLEAAQLAAFYSHAREQPKVAVHYTPKKFVNKPKGAAAGLVSLSSFKTILVEPSVPEGLA